MLLATSEEKVYDGIDVTDRVAGCDPSYGVQIKVELLKFVLQ
jgi:hypothetical protein